MTSTSILLKVIYTNLYHVVTASNFDQLSEDLKLLIRDLALNLITVKSDIPFVEYYETGAHSFDSDMNEKLLSKLLTNVEGSPIILSNRDFLKLRNLDSIFSTLFKS